MEDLTDDQLATARADDLVFGEATQHDLADVVALVQSAYRGDASRAGWTTEADFIEGQRVDLAMVDDVLADPDALVLTARHGATLVACCELRHRPGRGDAYLGMLAVQPGRQGSGLGRRVLAAAEDLVTVRWGVDRLALQVLDVRHELIAWYARRGYHPVGDAGAFPYGDERFGRPTRPDLRFLALAKELRPDGSSVDRTG